MTLTTRRDKLGTALMALGILLFVVPALVPIQPVLVHDTGPVTFDSDRQELESEGVTIIAYENLSERGQALYVRTLESGGEYSVGVGDGADDFEYLTSAERSERRDRTGNHQVGRVAIERPNGTDLPAADEPYQSRRTDGPSQEERRRQVQRYDLMATSTEPPGLGSVTQLLRLAAAVLAVLSVATGGYLLSRPGD